MTLNDSCPRFQGHAVFDAKYLKNGTSYRHRFNEILIETNNALLNSVISNDLEWLESLSIIFNDTKRRAVSLRQLSFFIRRILATGQIPPFHRTYFCFYRATHIHSADYGVARCPSVRLSVTRRYTVLCLNGYIISSFSSPSGNPIILVFLHQTGWQYSDRDPKRRRRMQEGKKSRFFDQYIALSRKQCKIDP